MSLHIPLSSAMFDADELNELFVRFEASSNGKAAGTSNDNMLNHNAQRRTGHDIESLATTARRRNVAMAHLTEQNVSKAALFRLPAELFDEIFNFVTLAGYWHLERSDTETLRKCSLVCSSLYAYVRPHLFASMHLFSKGTMDRKWTLLHSEPGLYSMARELTLHSASFVTTFRDDPLYVDHQRIPAPADFYWQVDPRAWQLLTPLTHITTLTMTSTRFWANLMLIPKDGIIIAAVFRNVSELTIWSCFKSMFSLYHFLLDFPSLSSLVLDGCTYRRFVIDPNDTIPQDKRLKLDSLAIHCDTTYRDTVNIRDALSPYIKLECLERFSGSLTSNTLSMNGSMDLWMGREFLASIGKSLVELATRPGDRFHYSKLDFIHNIFQHYPRLQVVRLHISGLDLLEHTLKLLQALSTSCKELREVHLECKLNHVTLWEIPSRVLEALLKASEFLCPKLPCLHLIDFVADSPASPITNLESNPFTDTFCTAQSRGAMRGHIWLGNTMLDTYDLVTLLETKHLRYHTDAVPDVVIGVKISHTADSQGCSVGMLDRLVLIPKTATWIVDNNIRQVIAPLPPTAIRDTPSVEPTQAGGMKNAVRRISEVLRKAGRARGRINGE